MQSYIVDEKINFVYYFSMDKAAKHFENNVSVQKRKYHFFKLFPHRMGQGRKSTLKKIRK